MMNEPNREMLTGSDEPENKPAETAKTGEQTEEANQKPPPPRLNQMATTTTATAAISTTTITTTTSQMGRSLDTNVATTISTPSTTGFLTPEASISVLGTSPGLSAPKRYGHKGNGSIIGTQKPESTRRKNRGDTGERLTPGTITPSRLAVYENNHFSSPQPNYINKSQLVMMHQSHQQQHFPHPVNELQLQQMLSASHLQHQRQIMPYQRMYRKRLSDSALCIEGANYNNEEAARRYCNEVLIGNDKNSCDKQIKGTTSAQKQTTEQSHNHSTLETPKRDSASVGKMPVAAITTTTTVTTAMVHSGTGGSLTTSTVTSTSLSSSMIEVIPDPPHNPESGKRKKGENEDSSYKNEAKRRIVDNPESEWDEENGDDSNIMKKLLSEVLGIKNSMRGVEETVKSIQSETKDWKKELKAVITDVNAVKLELNGVKDGLTTVQDSVEMAHNLIQDESNQRKNAIKDLSEKMNTRQRENSDSAKLINTHSSQIRTVKEEVSLMQTRLDAVETAREGDLKPIEEMKHQVSDMLGQVDFPPKRTVVGQNVWYRENEDLDKVASTIIHHALNLDTIKILRVQRKSGWNSDAGLIKMDLESNDDVKSVLKKKRELRNSDVPEIRNVFLRQSKKEEGLVAEHNQNIILQELGIQNSYVRLPSGHLTRREPTPRNTQFPGGGQ